jgi:hypothetical protein
VTAVDAAQAEVDDVHRLRDDAGFATLLGPSGQKTLDDLDAARTAYGEKTLPLIAKKLGLDLSGMTPAIASVHALPAVRQRDDVEWSGSLLGQVSATATMVMAFLPEAIATSAGMKPEQGTDEHPETYRPQDHDGLHEVVRINTRYTISIVPPKASLDLFISSVDTVTRISDGTEVARLEGNAHGHIEVVVCPDVDGVSPGSYELTLQEELVRPGSVNAGSAQSTKTPFRLFDGDDARLFKIVADMDLGRGAHGPGTPAGDWGVTATLPVTIQRNGGASEGAATNVHESNMSVQQGEQLYGQAGGAERYLGLIGRETEKFWRSGECIDLRPSDDTRKVDPEEKIHLSVDAFGKFDGQQIKAPIKATFTGKESLDPKDTPVDPPASFDFKAGKEQDDKGTIDLLQTGKRGIGKKKIEFTVDLLKVQAKIDATVHQDLAGNVYDTAIHLKTLDLVRAQDGTSSATGTVNWTTTYKPPTSACETKTYTGTFQTKVTARLDPADPTRVLVIASFIPGVLKPETLKCTGKSFPFNGGTSLGVWASLAAAEQAVTIGGSFMTHPAVAGGTASVTITITKKKS